MYAPPFFRPDRAASLAFAAARGFGMVCTVDGARPVASALPFCIEYLSDGTPCVAFHVARGNALAALADGKSNWLIAVNGADAYVSPHWYASPDQVPTWLYQAVHLSGPVRVMSNQELALHLDALSAKFESWLAPKPSWSTGEMTAGRREAMMKAIALALRADAGALEIARAMRAMRPDAFATETFNQATTPEGMIP
jgi:transcriptional regulator